MRQFLVPTTPSPKNDQRFYISIAVTSFLILGFLFWLIYFKPSAEESYGWVGLLPGLNATLNTITATLLLIGYYQIKQQKRDQHKLTMLLAVGTSALFLVSYVLYHHFHGDTKFQGQGTIRPIYFLILITHIVLSMIQVPLILTTLYHSWRKNWVKHKKFAQVTFPIWLYVSVTGVLIFVLIKQFNT